MKRIVSWILSVGIFLMCVSCASETEETTKKKKKKAKKTEASISEVIEDSTTTEEETTTSEETTAETTPIETTVETTVETEPPETTLAFKEIPEYVVPSEFQYDDSLEYLNVEYDEVFQQYGVFTDSSDYSAEMVREYLHLFNLDKNAGIDSLIMTVNSTMESAKAACDAEYDNALSDFLYKQSANLTPDSKYITGDYSITRADNAFLSFSFGSSCSESDCYNFVVATGEQVTINEIVKDIDSFCTLLENAFNRKSDDAGSLISKAKSGDLDFLLSYDGIYVGGIKISAIANPDVFNLEYFGATPKCYILQKDVNDQIVWDINGDGQNDTISFEQTYDEEEEEFETFTFDVCGVQSQITPADIDEGGWHAYIEDAYLMHSDSGFYLLIIGSVEDGYSFGDVFKINDDYSVSYSCPCGGDFQYVPYNPEYVVYWDYTTIGGASIEYYADSLIGYGDVGTYHTSSWRNLMQTKKEITGTLCDGSETTVSIPYGTYITCMGYDLEQKLIYFLTLNENAENNILVKLSLEGSTYPYTFGGENPQDMFRGYKLGG